MGLLDWLRGKSVPAPADPPHEQADLDWAALEQDLVNALTVEIANFASQHQDETFYGVALDCNAYYANVLLCANSPTALDEAAGRYTKNGSSDANAERESLRWGLGDWKYQGFNLDSETWQTGVASHLEEFAELPNQGDAEQFLVICCRALLRVEKNGVLSALQVTPDFRVACIDHDEDLAQGDARLNRVRAAP